jgi:hypothetical protein
VRGDLRPAAFINFAQAIGIIQRLLIVVVSIAKSKVGRDQPVVIQRSSPAKQVWTVRRRLGVFFGAYQVLRRLRMALAWH